MGIIPMITFFTRRRRWWAVGWLIAGIVVFASPLPSYAAACGAGVACSCGDTVVGDVTLTHDLGACGTVGLGVAGGAGPPITIDCNGFRIFSSSSGGTVGIDNTCVGGCRANVTVKNCTLEGFATGINIGQSSGWTVQANTIIGRLVGATVAGLKTGITGASSGSLKILGNDILEATDFGLALNAGGSSSLNGSGNEIAQNRITVYALTYLSGGEDGAMYLKGAHGDAGGKILIHSNYVDCPTIWAKTHCNRKDLWFETNGVAATNIQVYNNVFSGSGVGFSDPALGAVVDFCPTPAANASQYNIFSNSAATPSPNLCQKACVAPPTTATLTVTENTCFPPAVLSDFNPPLPPAGPLPPAIVFGADNVILDCNWDVLSDWLGRIHLSTTIPEASAVTGVGIVADGKRRGTVVGCEFKDFGSGIRLKNSQDFLLRWNYILQLRNPKLGFFYDVRSDHLDDPNFSSGVNPLDFRHQIYNPAYRPLAVPLAPQSFNWIGFIFNDPKGVRIANERQVLYFYGPANDGAVIDGDSDLYFGNVGHLTVADAQGVTVRDYQPGLSMDITIGYDPVKLACVGMIRNGACDTPLEGASDRDATPLGLVDNVSVTQARVGVYVLNSGRIAVQNSRAENTTYGLALMNVASTTIGCPGLACNRWLSNDEGVRAQRYLASFPATRLLLWNNDVLANTNGGVLVYDTDRATIHHNRVLDTGLSGDASALGMLLYGVQDGTVYSNEVRRSGGDNIALVSSVGSPAVGSAVNPLVSAIGGRGVAATRNFIDKNIFSDSVNGRGVYLNTTTVVPAGENFFGWKRNDGTACPTAAPYLNSPCLGHPPTLAWPTLAVGEYNNTVTNNARGGLTLFNDWNDTVYRNDVQNNGRDAAGVVIIRGSDGISLTWEAGAEVHDNQILGSSGWGLQAVDSTPVNLVGNTLGANDNGGLYFGGHDRTPVLPPSEIWSNDSQANGGPGLQFLYARGVNVINNTVRFSAAPGVVMSNSQTLALLSNLITADPSPASWPYLTVAALSGLARAQGFGATPLVDFYQHEIFQSNKAGPAGAERPVYYYAGNQEFLVDNTPRALPAASRIVENVCTTGSALGHLCQNSGDCAGGVCSMIQTHHLQIANSDQFTVRNFQGLNPLINADPLDLAYVSNSSLSNVSLLNCLGPCLRLFQSQPIGSVGKTNNTVDNLTITDPWGDGIVVDHSQQTTLTGLNITPGSGAIEGDAVHLEASPAIAATQNTLTRGDDPVNRFWGLALGLGSGGNFYGSTFVSRGAFEVRCQPGRDNCCNAANDTPDRCDPDCGLKPDGRPQDQDCSACTSVPGNCCLAIIDGACDADCPDFIDPDCWTKANGVPDASGTCSNNGRVPDFVCDYDCNSIDDPDCRPRPCSNTADGCCNASDDTPNVCDPDCSMGTLHGIAPAGDNPDPDCADRDPAVACFPAVNGSCDADCPAGVDPDCPGNSGGADSADDRCNGQSNFVCDPDCVGGGSLGSADPDCTLNLCTFRPAFRPWNTLAAANGVCTLDPLTGRPPDNGICDRDCLAAGTDPDCTGLDCCLPVADGSCDADCPFGLDPDCASRSAWPPRSGCQAWRDDACDYDCPAGHDLDCPAPAAARTSCDGNPDGCCQAARDFTCDPDCGTIEGRAVDPDCGSVCTTAADGCCLPTKDGVSPGICDPDCGLNPDRDRTPVDPDCSACTSAAGNCCVADLDLVCDLDCPGGADPDCSVQGQWCGDRSFQQTNVWPYAFPFDDDANYPYERGVPNDAVDCIASLTQFKPGFFVTQEIPPRGYTLAQREAARGDFKIEAEMADYEGSELSLGLLFAGETTPWTDPIDVSSGGPGWSCGAPKSYSCSASYFNADDFNIQPITPADPPLPRPKAFWPGSLYPFPDPSVDNDLPPGPIQVRLGVREKIHSRPWPNQTTALTDPSYITDVTAYWQSKTSVLANAGGLDGQRQPVWLELVASDVKGCTNDVRGGCFSAGPEEVVKLDREQTKPGWRQRQRVIVDLQLPSLPKVVTPEGVIRRVGPSIEHDTCGVVNRYVLEWDWATNEFTAGESPSWTPGKAHYEIWYGNNEDEVADPLRLFCSDATGGCGGGRKIGDGCDDGTGLCQVGDGNASNGPFVWEDISQGISGLPREACDWSDRAPKYDPNLAQLTCNQASRCTTTLSSKLSGKVSFAVCAVDDFGNRSACLLSIPKPWIQTQSGDVYAGQQLSAVNRPPSDNNTFLITTANTITPATWSSLSTAFNGGKIENYSNPNWTTLFPTYHNDFTTPAGTIWFLQGFDGSNFATFGGVLDKLRVRYGANRVVNLGAAMCGGGSSSLPAVLGGVLYFFDGDCTINTALTFANGIGSQDGSALFLINGNLTLNKNLQYSDAPGPSRLSNIASAAFVVLGGVQLASDVAQLDTSLIALGTYALRDTACATAAAPLPCGTILTGDDTASPRALAARGVFVARQFSLQRTYADLFTPSERFIYDGRLLANTPLGLEQTIQSLPAWR